MLRLIFLLMLGLITSAPPFAAEDLLRLPIGDPERRDRTAPIVLDAITDTRSGDLLHTSELVARLENTSILFLGEEHTNVEFHRVQQRVIRALHESGRQVLIAVEMFPYTLQKELDRWTRGQYDTENDFLDSVDWYASWGYPWEYYASIFRYARDNRLRIFGVNAPRDVIKAVRTEGFEKLNREDAEHIPTTVEPSNPDHRRVYLAYFDGGDDLHTRLPEDQFDGMVRAQATWDAIMGWNALQALRRHGGPDAIVVVMIGAGHAVYDVGAQRQLRSRMQEGMASLIPVPVTGPDGEAVEAVQASYADFIWGVPGSPDPIYPMLGISLAGTLGRAPNNVIQVQTNSPADAAGLLVGDQLLKVGALDIDGPVALRRASGGLRWGDNAEILIRRDDQELRKTLSLRRSSDGRN